MEKKSLVLWFTGMSGSGKSTLAKRTAECLEEEKFRTLILDGDQLRNHHHRHLSFSKVDILENNRLIAQLCIQQLSQYDVILVPIISPYILGRERARKKIGLAFKEVYIQASLEKLIERDTKGLYRKSIDGEMDNLIGFSDKNPYEEPIKPDVRIKTDTNNEDQCVETLVQSLRQWL